MEEPGCELIFISVLNSKDYFGCFTKSINLTSTLILNLGGAPWIISSESLPLKGTFPIFH